MSRKRKGIGARALRQAILKMHELSDERRTYLPSLIESELREMFPMKRIKQ